MFDKEKFTPEFYDKLSDSEKQEFVRCMLEEQLTDPLHIKGLPKPVQNSIKSAAKHCAKNMKEETIAGYPAEWINGIKSKDEKMMRGEPDEFPTPPKPVTTVQSYDVIHMHWNKPDLSKHDAMMYGDSFVPVNRSPRWVEKYLETKRWIDGIRDPEIDILTGCTQNFKPQQKIDMLDAMFNMLDTDEPDRNGRIWQKELLMKQLMKPMWMIPPRHHKSWMWMKLLQMQSYEIQQRTLMNPPSTKWNINSVIHMRWPKPDLSDLKAHDFRYGKMWQDQALINYATGDVSHIDTMLLDSLATFGPDINSGYDLSTPNLNDIDKKKLERVIKRRKKR